MDSESSKLAINVTHGGHESLFELDPLPVCPNSPFKIEIPSWCTSSDSCFVVEEVSTGAVYHLSSAPFVTIGRNMAAEVVIPDIAVSRIHAGILHDATKSYLIDLGSSQGTFIGSTRLKRFTPTLITNKSFIRFGPSGAQFMFRSIPSERYIVELAARIPCREEQKLFLNTQYNLFHLAAPASGSGNAASSLLMQHVIVRGPNSTTPRCRRFEGSECFCASAGAQPPYRHQMEDAGVFGTPLLCGAVSRTPEGLALGEHTPTCVSSNNLHELVTEEFVPDEDADFDVDTLPPLQGIMELTRMATWSGPEDSATSCCSNNSTASSMTSSTSSLSSLSEPHDDFSPEQDEESMDVAPPALGDSTIFTFAPPPSLSITLTPPAPSRGAFVSSPLALKQQCFTPAAGLRLGSGDGLNEADLQQHAAAFSALRVRAQTSDNELNTVVALSNECIKRCAEEAGVDVDDCGDCTGCDEDFEVDDEIACTTVVISPSKTFTKKGQTYSPVPTPRKLISLSIGIDSGAGASRNSFSNSSLSSGVSLGDLDCALGCVNGGACNNDCLSAVGSSSVSSDSAMSEFDDDACRASQGSNSSTNKLGRRRFAKKVRFSDNFLMDAFSSSEDALSMEGPAYSFGHVSDHSLVSPGPIELLIR